MKVNYKCKDNDVELKFIYDGEKIDEFWVRIQGERGWTVVGYDDFMAGVLKAEKNYNRMTNEAEKTNNQQADGVQPSVIKRQGCW